MLVICDIEWIIENGEYVPTQIAAIKVDNNWSICAQFNSLIKLPDNISYKKRHVAFCGGTKNDFEAAPQLNSVIKEFQMWIDNTDTLLWWFDESAIVLDNTMQVVLNAKPHYKTVILSRIQKICLPKPLDEKKNQYATAQQLNIDISKYKKHRSIDDVLVAIKVLSFVNYQQAALLNLSIARDSEKSPVQNFSEFPYHYDLKKKTIHKLFCTELSYVNNATIGFPTLDIPVKRKYKICKCCKSDYQLIIKARNEDLIARLPFAYIYSNNNDVFHKKDCFFLLNAKKLSGFNLYSSALKAGKKPCKVCKPLQVDPTCDEQKINTQPQNISKAIKRQKVANHEKSFLLENCLTKQSKKDVQIFTDTRYSFWAAKGYKNFHLHSCPTIRNLSFLRGFSTYGQAIAAGYLPCRKCKPSKAHNVKISIPVDSCTIENESINDLVLLCKKAKFEYQVVGKVFFLNTPVGKWKIFTNSIPIKLEHINLSMTPNETKYHNQPHLFFSLKDTFEYILHHDQFIQKTYTGI